MKRVNVPFELGDEVKDKISGIKGVAIGVTDWLNGCTRIGIQPKPKKGEVEIPNSQWVDVEQVELIKAAKPKKAERSGGPTPNPARHRNPKRR